LDDLKSRCGKPTNIVFDIDGTLIVGKTPVHILCKYYKNLCNSPNCEVKLLTARPYNMLKNTINQLKKNNLDLFDDIIMKDSKTDQETETMFKCRLIKELNPQISIGNRWHDLNLDDVVLQHLLDDKYVVGNNWLKMANNLSTVS
jgi:hypothetical protein